MNYRKIRVTSRSKNAKSSLSTPSFSKPLLILFTLIFASVGGYAIYRSFAAGNTFGVTTSGSIVDQATVNLKVVSPYSSTQSGTISQMSGYLSGGGAASGSETLEAIVYADSSGSPGALLGVSNPVTINASQAAGWVNFSFSSPVSVPLGTVWMGYISTGINNLVNIYGNPNVTNGLNYNSNSGGYSAGPTNPFGDPAFIATQNYQYSIYATYDGSGTTGSLPGDTNNDGIVNLSDLNNLLANWNTNNIPCDFNNDGIVNGLDLSILLGHYGQTGGGGGGGGGGGSSGSSATLGFNSISNQGDTLSLFPNSDVSNYSVFEMGSVESSGETPSVVSYAHTHNMKVFAYYNLQDDYDGGGPVCIGVCYSQALANNWLALYGGQPMNQGARGYPHAWTADIGNTNYVNTWCTQVINEAKSFGLDGVIMDNVMENGGYWIVGGIYPDKYPTQQSWADAYVAALQIIHQRFQAAGLLVAGNEIAWGDTNYQNGISDRAWAARITPYLDVVSYESLLVDGSGYVWGTPDDANLVSDFMGEQRDIEAAGKGYWAGVYSVATSGARNNIGDEQRMRYVKAAWMLSWSGNNSSAYIVSPGAWPAVDPNFDTNIGTPVDPVGGTQVNGGYKRAYTNGWVLWNPSGSSITINVSGGPYTDQTGQTGITGNVTVPPRDAVFLHK